MTAASLPPSGGTTPVKTNQSIKRNATPQPTDLREVGKVAVGKHGRVAQQLVADVGLGRVERAGVVADVLY